MVQLRLIGLLLIALPLIALPLIALPLIGLALIGLAISENLGNCHCSKTLHPVLRSGSKVTMLRRMLLLSPPSPDGLGNLPGPA